MREKTTRIFHPYVGFADSKPKSIMQFKIGTNDSTSVSEPNYAAQFARTCLLDDLWRNYRDIIQKAAVYNHLGDCS